MKKQLVLLLWIAGWIIGYGTSGQAAGILTPKNSANAAIQIRQHHVEVVINNGFAMTEVQQTFFNPNQQDMEAFYSFPLPKSASLSEVTIYSGEKEIHGEVVEKQQARQMYADERNKGDDAGLAEKNGFQSFDFLVSPVRAQQETRIRVVYYQPLDIDTGVGRYLYPLEEGNTDDAGARFWNKTTQVNGTFSLNLELKSAAPVADVRAPGYEGAAGIRKLDAGHYRLEMQLQDTDLNRDFVFYFRLQDNLPGRIELIPYRADNNSPGTFMLVVTPGIDLKSLTGGADYAFVLDVSGSMETKISTLARGVAKSLGTLQARDRFRIVAFNDSARDLTNGWLPATEENVRTWVRKVEGLSADGSTNVYDGLEMALKGLDDDRTTSIVLVTDGVTNTGIVEPREFHELMKQYDVRVFSFLMGNSANWPLMRTISESTGGYYTGVSNDDDIIGQIMTAKGKIVYESLHDATLKVSGVKVLDSTKDLFQKVYRGQQLVMFGRYEKGGDAQVSLRARLSGEDKVYSTRFQFPDIQTANPEIERLYALGRIEELETMRNIGAMETGEAESAIRDLGLNYQLVTDYTSMVVLTDAAFAERGIERRNQSRVAREVQARMVRAQQPIQDWRVDSTQPAFSHPSPSTGGGAIDPITAGIILLGLAGMALGGLRRRRPQES